MKIRIFYPLLFIGILVLGCDDNQKDIHKGYIPIYTDELQGNFDIVAAPTALKHPGKIYIYNNILLINEVAEGIHVYDNTNKKSPINLAFYKIPGCIDMAVRNSILYANFGNGLVSFNISDPQNPVFKDYIKSEFNNLQTPDPGSSVRNKDGYIIFKCPDPKRGEVFGWKMGEIEGQYCSIR
ncbi:MAG: hypothetical protein LC109_00645 [Bacteroidia bacterium]|nr:hypothetical protein [Bacteroidia bacterium]MCO5253147.1 hypothetical protein [Bacteroidota bacterium]MCZ2128758.1 hypothetical protein [Bacteroidia bacterium]